MRLSIYNVENSDRLWRSRVLTSRAVILKGRDARTDFLLELTAVVKGRFTLQESAD